MSLTDEDKCTSQHFICHVYSWLFFPRRLSMSVTSRHGPSHSITPEQQLQLLHCHIFACLVTTCHVLLLLTMFSRLLSFFQSIPVRVTSLYSISRDRTCQHDFVSLRFTVEHVVILLTDSFQLLPSLSISFHFWLRLTHLQDKNIGRKPWGFLGVFSNLGFNQPVG